MTHKNPLRIAGITIILSSIAFLNFTRSQGSEQVKNVQIILLISCGMLLGIGLFAIISFIKNKGK